MQASALRAKSHGQTGELDLVLNVTDFMLPWMVRVPAVSNDRKQVFITAVSNLVGPATPMNFGGSLVHEFHPISIPSAYWGINVAAIGYVGSLYVGVRYDVDMIPDVDTFTDGVSAELSELLAASQNPASMPTS